MEIRQLFKMGIMLLQCHGFDNEARQLKKIFAERKGELTWRIQDTQYEGDYLSLHLFSEHLSNVLFCVQDPDRDTKGQKLSDQLKLLLHVLGNLESSFTILKRYPADELEFERIAESVLISVFPKMRANISIDTALKTFKPDTAIPEAEALIDYKYIKSSNEIGPTVDEVNADIVGYRKEGYRHFVFVIYEDQRHTTFDRWKEQYKTLPEVSVILIKGSLNKPPSPGTAKTLVSQSDSQSS